MKQTIIQQALEAIEAGAKFKVNLTERNLSIDKKYLVKNGEYDGQLTDTNCFNISVLEDLYQEYKHSRPSERNDNKQRRYFKALKINELSDDDMLYGIDREVAQFRLESYLLCWILSGLFVWDEDNMGKWFWQSQNDKDLVILREWIDGKK